jgi:hypothetical protein
VNSRQRWFCLSIRHFEIQGEPVSKSVSSLYYTLCALDIILKCSENSHKSTITIEHWRLDIWRESRMRDLLSQSASGLKWLLPESLKGESLTEVLWLREWFHITCTAHALLSKCAQNDMIPHKVHWRKNFLKVCVNQQLSRPTLIKEIPHKLYCGCDFVEICANRYGSTEGAL